MSVTWLHISDFHIGNGDSYERDLILGALVEAVQRDREQGRGPQLIFATGDIANHGKGDEYLRVDSFFDDLLNAAGLSRRELFVVPGNHDVDRDLGVGLARTLDSPQEVDKYFRPGHPKPHISQKQSAFAVWYEQYFAGIRTFPKDSSCGPVEVVSVDGVRIGILPVNSALFAQADDDQEKLLVGRRCLDTALEELSAKEADLRVALLHHPLEYLSGVERGNVKTKLYGHVDILLRGHLHETEVESIATVSGASLHIAAGAAYQTRQWPNRALYATFDGASLTIFPIRYEDSPREVWTVDPSLFPDQPGFRKAFPVPRLSGSGVSPDPRLRDDTPSQTRFLSNVPARRGVPVVGREDLLGRIHERLRSGRGDGVIVLHGQPGVGKSEVAREYARRYRDEYPGGTFFVDGRDGAVQIELARLGTNLLGLEFPAGLKLEDQSQGTLQSLWSTPALIIFDDVMSEASIQRSLPPAGAPCQILVTTILDWSDAGWARELVEPLQQADSLSLIEALAGAEVLQTHGEALAEMSGGLPMQICPAAQVLAYESRRGRLKGARLVIALKAQERFHELVFDRLDSKAQQLLQAAAFLDGQHIRRSELGFHMQAVGWTANTISQELDGCLDFHLLDGNEELRMHQLLAAYLMESTEHATQIALVRQAQRDRFVALCSALVGNPADPDLAALLLCYPSDPTAWDRAGAAIAVTDGSIVGRALMEIGHFQKARPWFEQAVEAIRKGDVDGRISHDSLGRSLREVGYTYSGIGQWEEARPWFEQAVEAIRKGDVDGRVDHESLGRSLREVGYSYSWTGYWKKARPWFERGVEEARQGDANGRIDHESLGLSLREVGNCYSHTGDFDNARLWFERALEEAGQGDVFGRVDHESIGRHLHEVGWCHSSKDNFEEALSWFERAVEESGFGDVHGRVDHESIGRHLHEVGWCHLSMGRFEEARLWFERAVEAARHGDPYGRVDHESLGRHFREIGRCHSSRSQWEEARAWFEQAVEQSRQGDVHGRVDQASLSLSLRGLADCMRSLGHGGKAKRLEGEPNREAAKGSRP